MQCHEFDQEKEKKRFVLHFVILRGDEIIKIDLMYAAKRINGGIFRQLLQQRDARSKINKVDYNMRTVSI